MKLPNGETLMHAGKPYDPRKAHEYYLRTRKLKGRKRGGLIDAAAARVVGLADGASGRQPAKKNQDLQNQRANAKERVENLKKKLNQLNAALKERMAEAKKAESEAKKPDTAAEKSGKAREAKKYRDKNEQKLKTDRAREAGKKGGSSKKKSGGTDSVDELKAKVESVRKNLKAAIAKQRALG